MIQHNKIRHILSFIASFLFVVLGAMVLVCVLIVMQGGRDEAQQTDALVIFCPVTISEEYIDHAMQLYRRGYATRMVLIGEDPSAAHDIFIQNSYPDAAILLLETSSNRWTDMRQMAETAYQHHITSIVLIDRPSAMLYDLKMAHDLGLEAYGSPLPTQRIEISEMIYASLDYWDYILFAGHTPLMQHEE